MSKPEHTPSGSGGGEDDSRTLEPDLTPSEATEPSDAQPGLTEPSSAEPDAAKPAGPKPTAAKPGLAKPGSTEGDAATSASAEPASAAPDPAKPAGPKPGLAKSGPAKSAAATPSADAPDSATPGSAEPADAAPASAEPAGLKPDLAKPATPKQDGAKPGSAESVGAKPDLAKQAVAASDSAKPAAAPDSAEPAGAKSAAAKRATAKPSADAPDSATPDPAEPAGAKQDLAKPGAAKRGSVVSDSATPGSAESGRKGAGRSGEVKAKGVTGDTAEDEGRLLARRYRLDRVLGKGGMGTVWRAVDETLGRTVAVKELRFSSGVDEDEKRRLITRTLREAKAIARIRSGGAVTVFDVVDEDGRPWIVMELIEGSSLAEFIRDRGTLTPRRAAEVGLAVLDVLKAAHGEGILHRDVKPSNVLISDNGRVVLTDFGIAQVEGDPSVTSTGMLVGAPSYISPERARGQKPGPPADMWSLGGLLYAAVEGVPPYDKGSALATLTAVMTEPVDPPKNAGPLTDVIYGLLVRDPARRLDDAGARALLTAVINAPEEAPAEAPADETRVISLSAAKEAAEQAAADKAAEKAAEKAAAKAAAKREREQRERAREALKAARKAAAAAAAVSAASAAEAPAAAKKSASEAATPAGSANPPAPRRASVVAPLTDVMNRRTIALAIAAVVVVLAVVGSLVVWAFGDDEDKGGKGTAKGGTPGTKVSGTPTPGGGSGGDAKGGSTPAPGQSPGQSPGQGSGDQGSGAGTGSGSGSGSGTGDSAGSSGTTPGGPGGTGTSGLPAGYKTVTDAEFHFAIAMPEYFQRTGTAGRKSGAIFSRDGGFPRLQVDFNNSPKDDARLAWQLAQGSVAGSSEGYRVIDIKKTEYRGYPTVADWEFERVQGGVKVRVLNRGFKVDAKHGYAIMISCAADQWDGEECTKLRSTAFDTFQPVD
ncbi:protein kinase [Streptomyces sp. NPDC002054]|uniref:serine/threonine protein kinase n=1 Tax=Streptomyces sp. NPDC002054 TaxID=3154663 RepID=UPI003322AEA6